VFFLIAARYSSGDWHRLVHVRIAGRPGTDLRPQVGAAVRYPAAGHGADHSRHSRTQWTVRPAARFLAAQGCIACARDLRGHGRTAGPGKLGQAGITAWHDMTADIKQLADIARTEHPDLPLIAFGHSMG
jgi:alpha-beta hydrolase superfamily lysophospholipase